MNKVVQAAFGAVPQRRPRTKIVSMNDQGAVVSSRLVGPADVTPAAAQFAFGYQLSPTLYVADAGCTVLRNYQEYTYRDLAVTYTPAIGTTTPGTVWMGFYDSPEICLKSLGTYTQAELLTLAKQSPVNACGPIWMPNRLQIPMMKRRGKYATNSQVPGTREGFDLEVHGVCIVATEGVPFSTAFGNIGFEYTALGYHLENNSIANV